MANVSLEVDENDVGEVVGRLQADLSGVSSEVEDIIARYSLLIARDAKDNAPVDTGRLRASITPQLEDLASRIVAGSGEIAGANVDYAAVQEFGDDQVEGKKYMTRAFRKHEDDFKKEIRDALSDFGT